MLLLLPLSLQIPFSLILFKLKLSTEFIRFLQDLTQISLIITAPKENKYAMGALNQPPPKITLIGLGYSGQTTIFEFLRTKLANPPTTPTSLNIGEVTIGKRVFEIWDQGWRL